MAIIVPITWKLKIHMTSNAHNTKIIPGKGHIMQRVLLKSCSLQEGIVIFLMKSYGTSMTYKIFSIIDISTHACSSSLSSPSWCSAWLGWSSFNSYDSFNNYSLISKSIFSFFTALLAFLSSLVSSFFILKLLLYDKFTLLIIFFWIN